jgi:hypothetical protein
VNRGSNQCRACAGDIEDEDDHDDEDDLGKARATPGSDGASPYHPISINSSKLSPEKIIFGPGPVSCDEIPLTPISRKLCTHHK